MGAAADTLTGLMEILAGTNGFGSDYSRQFSLPVLLRLSSWMEKTSRLFRSVNNVMAARLLTRLRFCRAKASVPEQLVVIPAVPVARTFTRVWMRRITARLSQRPCVSARTR